MSSVVIHLSHNRNFNDLDLIVIPIAISGKTNTLTFDFLLDTGSQRTVLDFGVQKILGIETKQEVIRGGGLGGTSQYPVGTITKMVIGSIDLGNLDVLMGNLPDKFKKNNIDGILGADVLKQLHLVIDYRGKVLLIS